MAEKFETIGEGDFAISVDYLIAINEYASECGMTPQEVLRDTSIPLNALIKPNIRIRHHSMDQVVRNVIQGLNDPLLPIRYGKRLTLSRHGVLGFAAQSSQSLLDAAQFLIRFIQTRSGGGERIQFDIAGDMAHLSFHAEDSTISSDIALFHSLSVFISIETIARWLAGKTHEYVASEILLSFDAPCEIPEKLLSPGLVIKFNQTCNELRCPLAYLKEPLASANPTLFHEAKKECEIELVQLSLESDITAQVRTHFRNYVDNSVKNNTGNSAGNAAQSNAPYTAHNNAAKSPTLDIIADKMSMSSRTLKRKLHDAGTTYQKIKDAERFKLAINLLENTKDTIEKIAESLGYSDASNFTKAFKNWAEMSPNEYRLKVIEKS